MNMTVRLAAFMCGVLLMFGRGVSTQAAETATAGGPPPVSTGQIVATVNGEPIMEGELDACAAALTLTRNEALEDLIDLRLVQAAAAAQRINMPDGRWSPEVRAGIEYALAKALGVKVPPMRAVLVVDHAWVKDAPDKKGRAAGMAQLKRMRALVKAGATIPQAYARLRVNGDYWHIGDHEEYPYDVLPVGVRDLQAGALSRIIPGDGGLHLFRIYQRTQELPPSDDVHVPLNARLRQDAVIERY